MKLEKTPTLLTSEQSNLYHIIFMQENLWKVPLIFFCNLTHYLIHTN